MHRFFSPGTYSLLIVSFIIKHPFPSYCFHLKLILSVIKNTMSTLITALYAFFHPLMLAIINHCFSQYYLKITFQKGKINYIPSYQVAIAKYFGMLTYLITF